MENKLNENLKRVRIAHHLNQNELAKDLHVSRPTISSWETGRNTPDINTLIILVEYYQVPLNQLIFDDQPSKSGPKSNKIILNILLSILLIERITQYSNSAGLIWMDSLIFVTLGSLILTIKISNGTISLHYGVIACNLILFTFGILSLTVGLTDPIHMGFGFETTSLACGITTLVYLSNLYVKNKHFNIKIQKHSK